MGTIPQLSSVLAQVRVAPDLRHASVAGRELHADSGRDLRRRLVNALYRDLPRRPPCRPDARPAHP
ncbi:hypothetical protein ACHZ98_23305 [Streptomyces sp. MAR4 CNY-716]